MMNPWTVTQQATAAHHTNLESKNSSENSSLFSLTVPAQIVVVHGQFCQMWPNGKCQTFCREIANFKKFLTTSLKFDGKQAISIL